MKSTQQALKDSIIPALTAGLAVMATVAARGRKDSHSSLAPINSTSHVLWGAEAGQVDGFSARHSLPGLVINAGAGLWWAAVFQKLFGEQADRRGPMVALAGGLATAGLAYVVDYKLVPKRLTPGWELRISDKSLYMSLAAMGLGLGVGAILARRYRL